MFKDIASELVSGRCLFFVFYITGFPPENFLTGGGVGRGEERASTNNEIMDILVIFHNLSKRSII